MSKLLRLGQAVAIGQTVVVDAGLGRHMAALRLTTVGATFDLVDAVNGAFSALVTSDTPLTVRIVSTANAPDREPQVDITVCVPVLKGGRSEEVLRNLTELGVSRFVLYTSAHSVVRVEPAKQAKKQSRWSAIIDSSTEQCGRVVAPSIRFCRGLPTDEVTPGIFLTVMERPSVRETLAKTSSPVTLLVGPEGGLSADEISALERHGWQGAWLGHRILRAETACIAATTLALHALGEGGY